jgi:hypothetical protein
MLYSPVLKVKLTKFSNPRYSREKADRLILDKEIS